MSHHQTCPQFYEEIKVELPPNIHDGHHVKIVIYHVSVDPKKMPKKSGTESVLTEIGSTWIRLRQIDGRLDLKQKYDLPGIK